MKEKQKRKKEILFAYLMAGSLFLSGCGENDKCMHLSKHVHKYVKETPDGYGIVRYIESEKESIDDYIRYDEYYDISKDDEEIYKFIEKNDLFVGKDNWDYLYNLMAKNTDHLEYYYEMPTTQIYNSKDGNGRVSTKKHDDVQTGWHSSPNNVFNTGEIRSCHYMYYGYNIEKKNGRLELVKSPLVDNIRDIINDYPYFSEDCFEVVYENYVANKDNLDKITTNDLSTNFGYPNLDNKSMYMAKVRIKR